MSLYYEPFALDTESDVYVDGNKKTKLVQICPISATSLDDVRLYFGWDALNEFFLDFDRTVGNNATLDCHVYNLGGYEFSHIWREVLQFQYEYTEDTTPKAGQWTALADDKTVYKVLVRNYNGCVLRITDDMRRFGNVSMKKASESVRNQHPDWFPTDKTKLESDYHDGWLDENDSGFENAIQYSKQDAFSQAMLTRWLVDNGYSKKLTAPSNGLNKALEITYDAGRYNKSRFKKQYPPLDREMQDIAERSLLGGFVYGEVGTFYGTFCHLDYSSSYPYEYVYGNLFEGKVTRLTKYHDSFEFYRKGDYQRWYLVSFDFEFKGSDVAMPCIAGKECDGIMIGRLNNKMRSGHISKRLYTESYLEELKQHYNITNLEEHELWIAKKKIGGFRTFIEHCYTMKQTLKEEGKGNSADYLVYKLYMNGGIHGKTITKTNRKKRTFYNGESQLEIEQTDPDLCFLIGFTAMMNARERLLKHCRRALSAGYRVMMCDTDSMILNCSADKARILFADWLEKGGHTLDGNLGRFEIETFQGIADFEEFKCWGLKRYAEIHNVNGKRILRKTAFAGMRENIQHNLLDWKTDGTEYKYVQPGKKTMKYGATIVDVTKTMKAENIWDTGEIEVPPPSNVEIDFTELKEFCAKIIKAEKRGDIDGYWSRWLLFVTGNPGLQRQIQYRVIGPWPW